MNWVIDKLSTLLGTIVAAVAGGTASQVMAYVQAYLQRLGGHIDEARKSLASVRAGDMAAVVNDVATRDQLAAAFQRRLADLESARSAIDSAGSFAKPVALLSHLDRDIAVATAQSFTPALPLDPPSLVFALGGIVLGWLIWDLLKAPFVVFRRGRV